MQRDQAKTKLSTGILNMKFMKKTKEKLEKEQEDNEGRLMYANNITEEMRTKETRFIIVNSRITCEDLQHGRVSFGGMNPEIERIMQEERGEELSVEEKKKETDISDIEMAKNYSSVVETLKSKFDKNKRRSTGKQFDKSNKKIKFLKPEDT